MLMREWFGTNTIFLSDPAALSYILLQRNYAYAKSAESRVMLERLLGRGLVTVEGEEHRKQRRIMNAPFSWSNVKSYCPEFQKCANKLIHRMGQLVDDPDKTGTPKRGDYVIVEVSAYLGRCTLDIIGR